MKRKITFGVLLLALCVLAWLCTDASAATAAREADAFIVAEAEGTGTSEDQALADACRRAVQQAIGFLSKGTSRSENGRTEEHIVRLSRAFIEKYETTARREEQGRHTVSIRAWIRKENLLAGLLQKDPNRSVLDGVSLVTRAATREQQIQEAGELLIDIFRSIPLSHFVRCSVEAGAFKAGAGKLKTAVHFRFDRDLYFSQTVPQLVSVLDYVSEASIRDVPFLLPLKGGETVTVEPPAFPDSLPRCRELMEMPNGNRYIDLPDGGGFANVYILTRNYYFNAYRLAPEAFARLMEALFRANRQGVLGGALFGQSVLNMDFKGNGEAVLLSHAEPLQLHNILLFTDLHALKKSPWAMKKNGPPDERSHALFILPAFGTLQGDDYLLLRADEAELEVKASADVLKAVKRVDCSVETELHPLDL